MGEDLFSGLRVIDVASFIAAPAAASILADYGADVIKVEPPGLGDPMRHFHLKPGMPASEHAYFWTLLSRNKRGVALDLKTPEGREQLGTLVAGADVFITNMPLPVRERLGISYDRLAPLNERLIYASFTGYGEVGEEKDLVAFDSTAWWARSGLMDQVRWQGSPPARSTPGMGDHMAALALYGAIVTALLRREKTGKGSHVGSSLLANGVWSNAVYIQAAIAGASFTYPPPRESTPNALSNHYLCSDGAWLSLAMTPEQQAASWPALVDELGHPGLVDDPRFATIDGRIAHTQALIRELDRAFARRSSAEWKTRFVAKGINASIVARASDAVDDAQMRASEVLVPMPEAEGAGLTVSSPFWIEGVAKVPAKRPPGLGEHTREVLTPSAAAAE